MTAAFLPAVFGALIVIGLIGMVYAMIPAPPKPPRPARTTTPFGRLGSLVRPARPAHPDADGRRRSGRPPGRVGDRLGDRYRARPGRDRRYPAAAHAPAGGRQHREARGARGVDPVAIRQSLTAGQSLRSALIKSLQSAPAPIEREVGLMVSRLWNNTATTEDVLRAFAEDLNDSTGDVVASQPDPRRQRPRPGRSVQGPRRTR
ncbi:hypothetical protein [Nocardioides convexus]|uniref:hypothetical protein n=1 Tax=Nocardioides convexus TaxID=2712224 RepID=UPI002418B5D3|nr:hypothetical protein [Nocardioides convexus]